jgi:type I restriction-modification system DNA methylase subunit
LDEKGPFDVIVGNPPWGGIIDDARDREEVIQAAGVDSEIGGWDSWEIFVILAYTRLREGGRLNLVLPDTLLSPEKQKTREFLLSRMTIEKLYLLGPDWFGPP